MSVLKFSWSENLGNFDSFLAFKDLSQAFTLFSDQFKIINIEYPFSEILLSKFYNMLQKTTLELHHPVYLFHLFFYIEALSNSFFYFKVFKKLVVMAVYVTDISMQ